MKLFLERTVEEVAVDMPELSFEREQICFADLDDAQCCMTARCCSAPEPSTPAATAQESSRRENSSLTTSKISGLDQEM